MFLTFIKGVTRYKEFATNLIRPTGGNVSNKLLALKLVLEALGVGTNIGNVTERKEKQKAIYLVKALTGLDLGYSYGWYIRGPYSPSLANDYYELQNPNEALTGTLREDIIQ